MSTNACSRLSVITLLSPIGVIALAFALRSVADETVQMRALGVGMTCFGIFALFGSISAFRRKESLRWLTLLPVLMLLGLSGFGVGLR